MNPLKEKGASSDGSFIGERLFRQPGKIDTGLIPD